jgi:uncharacterized protein (TIGR02145 family)
LKTLGILSCVLFLVNAFLSNAQLVGPGQGVVDAEGNFYPTIILENGQEWMASDLRVAQFNNGDPIPLISEMTAWATTYSGAATSYDNDQSYTDQYGMLYNFHVTQQESGVCPVGWRVPSESDWIELTEVCGGLGITGGKLKQAGTGHWVEPNTGATDELGFQSLPGGCRYDGGLYNNLGLYSFYWTSTQLDSTLAWYRSLKYNTAAMNRNFSQKQSGYSIRCLRNIQVGLDESPDFDFEIVPNPVTESFVIIPNIGYFPEGTEIKLIDLNGSVIRHLKLGNSVHLSDLNVEPGYYFLSLDFHVQHVVKKLLIK